MLKRLINDDFLKNNVIFFIGSMAVAVLNYLYHPVLGRMLSVEDFGEVQALISLFLQFSVLFVVTNTLIVNITANIEEQDKKSLVIGHIQKILFGLVVINLLLMIIFRETLQRSLNFESFLPFISLAFIYVFSVSFTVRKAILHGKSDFASVSRAGVVFAGGKLVFAAMLVYLGMRSFGAITGLLIAQIMAFVYAYYKTREDLRTNKSDKQVKVEKGAFRKELSYAGLVLMANLTITFMYTADVILVKYWFSPTEAGLYGGMATIARIIYFATGSITGVMLPTIKIKNEEKDNLRLLMRSMGLIFLIGGCGALIFALFPNFIISLLIGKSYTEFAGLLPLLAILLFLVSLVNLLFNYLLALRRFWLIPMAMSGLLAIFGALTVLDRTIENVIISFIIGACTIIFGIILKFIYNKVFNKIKK